MSTDQEYSRSRLRMAIERDAFDLGAAHYEATRAFPKDLGTVAGVLDLARTTTQRFRVYRAVRKGLEQAHFALLDSEVSK